MTEMIESMIPCPARPVNRREGAAHEKIRHCQRGSAVFAFGKRDQSTDFMDSTMLIFRRRKCMMKLTKAEKAKVSTTAMTKLGQ